jgi:hypothetical protein
MRLLCVGDVAVIEKPQSDRIWPVLDQWIPGENARILFNWELPIGERLNPVPRSCGGPRLLSYPGSPGMIRQWAPGFAALATNHALDAGEQGLAETLTALRGEGFITVGAGSTPQEIARPLIWETKEGRLGIINWVFPETNPDWMRAPGSNCWPGIDGAKSAIRNLKREVDWVLVLAHWSDELFPYPRPEDRLIARELAEAGTDLLVGHHPHVVRGMEIMGSCPVFYSLGNFYFCDYMDPTSHQKIKWAPRSREGLGIEIHFKQGQKPEYQPLSSWQKGDSVMLDPFRRATRRMESGSRPLNDYLGAAYEKWYAAKRKSFDKLWARWEFGVRRLGVQGLAMYILRKLHSRAIFNSKP